MVFATIGQQAEVTEQSALLEEQPQPHAEFKRKLVGRLTDKLRESAIALLSRMKDWWRVVTRH